MSDTLYDSIDALNWSSLKYLYTSALLFKYRQDHPEPPKSHYTIGNGIHCRALEPEVFDSRYAIWDMPTKKGDKLTPRTPKAVAAWDRPGVEPLLPEEMDNVKRAGDAVLAHPVAASILKGCRHEEPLVWIDPITGIKCKGRVDSIRASAYIVDLKSDRDPSPRVFSTKAARLMYHGQIAFYQTGAIATGKISKRATHTQLSECPECGELECDHDNNTHRVEHVACGEMPYIIAVEKEPPYDVGVYRLKPDDLDAGRNLCVSLMHRLEDCIEADYWPGVAPELQYLELPNWAPGMNIDEGEDF